MSLKQLLPVVQSVGLLSCEPVLRDEAEEREKPYGANFTAACRNPASSKHEWLCCCGFCRVAASVQ